MRKSSGALISLMCAIGGLVFLAGLSCFIVIILVVGIIQLCCGSKNDPRDDEEELPMQQIFPLNDTTSIIVDHVELCPEETAFIRVINDEAYSKIYKRRVYTRYGTRYFLYNSLRMELDDSKTQPRIAMSSK